MNPSPEGIQIPSTGMGKLFGQLGPGCG